MPGVGGSEACTECQVGLPLSSVAVITPFRVGSARKASSAFLLSQLFSQHQRNCFLHVGETHNHPESLPRVRDSRCGPSCPLRHLSVAQIWIQRFPHPTHLIQLLEKEMTTHSSVLAWRISWTEDPDSLSSVQPKERGELIPLVKAGRKLR